MDKESGTIKPNGGKASHLKRSLSLVSNKKPYETLLDNTLMEDIFRTNLERMINDLHRIKNKLQLMQEYQLVSETNWMIDTLLKNKLNDVVIKLEKSLDKSENIDIERMLDFLSEYSSEFQFKRSIEKLQSTLINKLSINTNTSEFDNSDNFYILYDKIFNINFDIFEFCDEVGRDNVFPFITSNIFIYFNLLDNIDNQKLKNFLIEIKNGYKKSNPYHNDLHAADVTQTISLFLIESNMSEVLQLEKMDILSFIISSIVHDYKHTGQNNSYHINKQTELALLYNDNSVLENYHISEAFRTINNPNNNILENFSKIEYKLIRKRITQMILSTDMSFHAKIYSSLKIKVENLVSEKIDIESFIKSIESPSAKFDSQQEILNYCLHAADISHNVKSFQLTQKWTDMVMNEFWEQGDIELKENLPISFNCDRRTANVPKDQIGFLTGIINPTFSLLSSMFPNLELFVTNARNNVDQWNKILNK